MWMRFRNCLNNLTFMYVPTSKILTYSSACYTSHLKNMKNAKQRIWNKFKNNKANCHFTEYKNYFETYKRKIVEAKSRYEENNFLPKNTKPRQFFHILKNVTKSKVDLATLSYDGKFHMSDAEKN